MGCVEDKLTFSEIRERANLPEEDLVRILHSLSCSKYKILSKEPPTKTPGKTDTFFMNANFTDRMRRIRVRPLPLPNAVAHPAAPHLASSSAGTASLLWLRWKACIRNSREVYHGMTGQAG